MLQQLLGRRFSRNRNSFASCFQYDQVDQDLEPILRVKVYNKQLAWLQSRSAMMPLGMNTKKLFMPAFTSGKIMKETEQNGYSRIEISYVCKSIEAQDGLYRTDFLPIAR